MDCQPAVLWSAGEAHGGQFGADSPVAVTAAAPPENRFDNSSKFFIQALAGIRFGRMITAAARHFQDGADDADGVR